MRHKCDWKQMTKGINPKNGRLEALYQCSICSDKVTVSAN